MKNVFEELLSIDIKDKYILHLIKNSRVRLEKTKELLDDILSIGNPKLDKKNICVNNLVQHAIELAKAPYTKVSGETINIIGDKPKTTRAIANLINNAHKHSNSSEPVEIILVGKGVKLIKIKNYGSYLTENQINKMFDPFVSKGSTGLGLYITRSIVNAHNWKIRCLSSEKENSVSMEIIFN